MMCPRVVFTLVISKILFSRVPFDIIHILGNLITHPKISHFCQARSLSFDGVVCNAYGGGIVAMNGCFWLRMALFFESHTKNHALFAVQEEGA
jgi:hypothetical protein